MIDTIDEILIKDDFNHNDIVTLLNSDDEGCKKIFRKASELKAKYVGKRTYFRGLIELTNICEKDCYYCDSRKGNNNIQRYSMTDTEVFRAVKYAIDNKFSSILIKSGEVTNTAFTDRISVLLKKIAMMNNHDKELGIALAIGDQTENTYQKWYDMGADCYLIRIETSNKELYKKIHPSESLYDYDGRVSSIKTLQKLNYQTGTGIMIGLPFQTVHNLADDILFMRDIDIDMVDIETYIERPDTLLYQYKDVLLSKKERFDLTMKMVAIIRIVMKDINIIAATTSMKTLHPLGCEKAIEIGANIIMPNLTPLKYREGDLLNDDKFDVDKEGDDSIKKLEATIACTGDRIAFGEIGTSKHFLKRITKKYK